MNHIARTATLAVLALLGGCSSQHYSQPSVPLHGEVRADLKADVQVGELISGQSSVNVLLGVFRLGADTQFADGVVYGAAQDSLSLLDPVAATKAAAAYKAVKSSGADLLVAPRYEIDVQDYLLFKTVSVRVTGHKGLVRGIR